MQKRLAAVLLFIGLSVLLSGCATYQMHPEFKERHKNIFSGAVMPPDVEIYKLSFKGDKDMMFDLIPPVQERTQNEVEKILGQKGYIVKELDLSENALSSDPELRTTFFNVRTVFNKNLEDIKARKRSKFTYDIGSDVNTFADMANADMLIFTREVGLKKTGGEIAKDLTKSVLTSIITMGVYTPIYAWSDTVVQLAVVDSNDGAILWYNDNAGLSGNIDAADENQIRGTVANLLRPFPNCVAKESKRGGTPLVQIKNLPVAEPQPKPLPSQRSL